MVEVEIKGNRKLCFLVKKGEANDVVIPIDSLVRIDYVRLSEMEKQGGELMKVMRETTLPNGKNALVQYQLLLVTVEKNVEKKEVVKEEVKEDPKKVENTESGETTKRGRGRPRKDK